MGKTEIRSQKSEVRISSALIVEIILAGYMENFLPS
jgi:hypothetical protein